MAPPDEEDELAEKLSQFSPSVKRAVRSLPANQPVTAWSIVRSLCKIHPEYGDKLASELISRSGPADAMTRPIADWLTDVRRIVLTPDSGVIHGRATILALARLDATLAKELSQTPFLSQLEKELPESVRWNPEPKSANETIGSPTLGISSKPDLTESESIPEPAAPTDPTPLRSDNPAIADELGRAAFAKVLAARLTAIWNDRKASELTTSFMIHLHGPWGAGKSSVLNLLRQQLQPDRSAAGANAEEENTTEQNWIVVDFNGWQNQRFTPPWWPLLNAIYRQSKKQLSNRYGHHKRSFNLTVREFYWRFITSNREQLIRSVIILVIGGLLAWLALQFLPHVLGKTGTSGVQKETLDLIKSLIAALTAVAGLVIALAGLVSRPFLTGSAFAAQSFLQSAVDPLARITGHFEQLIDNVGQPVIVFIDDLDRCNIEYVVSLLEGVQTLFTHRNLFYIVAADRRWLNTCYEKSYQDFAVNVHEPGRGLGSLFLEKGFQLSVALPRLSPDWQVKYWDSLVIGSASDLKAKIDTANTNARNLLAGATTSDEIAKHLKPGLDPLQNHALREEAILRLATPEAEKITAYFLRDFARFLEPNPRSMKRLLNAYGLHRDIAVLAGLPVLSEPTMRKQLVLWTIVSLRWPVLEDFLVQEPEAVEAMLGPNQDHLPEEIRHLSARKSVRKVLSGDGITPSLTKEVINRFAELRTSNADVSAVH